MIHHVKGDLLASDCNFIGHQSNCLLGFGSGIAGGDWDRVYKIIETQSEKHGIDIHLYEYTP
jgi:O-acetyl-ADP-ribose deacetylase (regulator of RNase III)